MKSKMMKNVGKMSMAVVLGFIITACSTAKTAASGHLDYKAQSKWEFEAGDAQSPINIVPSETEIMEDSGNIILDYHHEAEAVVDNGHSIETEIEGEAMINGRKFELTQFHLHAKSEHTIDGKHYPLEVHFVNKEQDGRLAVIGVFLTEGKANQAFQTMLDNISDEKDESKAIPMNVNELIPTNKSYYHYLGSLTTPPLSENVEWYVMSNPVEVSAEQIKTFNKYYSANNREIQEKHERPVLEHKEQ